jgi:tetratricopeptide (TPR) repeat protein
MSPEQAAGRELDGRSDLYSLGVVFYRMLTGDVPYKADSAVAIGIKHLQEPIPKLPNYLTVFQGVIDRVLAKKPEHRYQTGAELTVALEEIKSAAQLPNATLKTMAVTTQEIRAVGGALLTTVRDPSRSQRQQRRRKRQRLARQALAATVLVSAIGGVAYLVDNQPLWLTTTLARFDLAENPLVPTAWSDAQSLHQDPNQSLSAIVASYRRVLALDPEHAEAQQTIDGLAQQWKTSIEASLLANDLAQAQTKLDESVTAFPTDPALTDLERQLTNRKHAGDLLLSTQALLRSHGLSDVPSATAAIQAYHEVIRLAPEHPIAQAELTTLSEHYAGLAREAASRGDVQGAISFLERATAADDELPSLASVGDEIRQATTAQAAIAELVQRASEFRSLGLLVDPPGENAAELYHRVLATAPDNVIAQQGLNEVTSQLLSTAAKMLSDDDLDGVQTLVDRASAAGIDAAVLLEIKTQLDNTIATIATVDRNLTEAQSLLEQGFITEPESGNAVALLRDIERLDPGNAMAAELLAQAASRLADAAQEAYTVGLTDDAKYYLELALTVTPDALAWRELRESWD